MLICPAIGDTDPIRCQALSLDGQFSDNIIDEAVRIETQGKNWLSMPH
jgi:hypothetical protein